MSLLNLILSGGTPRFSSYSVISSKAIIEDYDGDNTWHGRSSMVDMGSYWAMAFVEGAFHSGNGDNKTQIVFSEDKGVTWKPKNTFIDDVPVTGFVRQGNGSTSTNTLEVLLIRCPNGDLIAIVQDRDSANQWIDMYQSRSTDGGKTWGVYTSLASQFEGSAIQNWAFYDSYIDGLDIYMTGSYTPTTQADVFTNANCILYKSTDNGATWTKVSDICASGEAVQSGIIKLANGNFFSTLRTDDTDITGLEYTSSTDGITWSALTQYSFGAGIHQNRLRLFAGEGRLYNLGRWWADGGTNWNSAIMWSDNQGVTWSNFVFNEGKTLTDGGYVDCIKRDSNTFYVVCYEGTTTNAKLWEYIIRKSL